MAANGKMSRSNPHDVQLIAIMGATGAGKSSFTNLILKPGQPQAVVGHGVLSCTKEVQPMPFNVEGYQGSIVDTPGFDDSELTDSEILTRIANWMEVTYRQNFKLTGILYLRDITDARMTGSAKKNFRMFRKLCGTDEKALCNVKIVTTKWDEIPLARGEAREKDFAEHQFKDMLDGGAQMLRHDNTLESAVRILSTVFGKGSMETKLQDELVNKGLSLIDTDAGAEVMDDIEELMKRHEEELNKLQKELKEAAEQDKKELQESIKDIELLREQDRVKADQAKEALEKDRKKEMDKMQEDLEKLAASKGSTSTEVMAQMMKQGIVLVQALQAANAAEHQRTRAGIEEDRKQRVQREFEREQAETQRHKEEENAKEKGRVLELENKVRGLEAQSDIAGVLGNVAVALFPGSSVVKAVYALGQGARREHHSV